MPRPSERTRSKRRVFRGVPGGGWRVHYRAKAAAVQRCCVCGRSLDGLPRSSGSEVRGLSRGQKRVGRPFGGQVCSGCLKLGLRRAARSA